MLKDKYLAKLYDNCTGFNIHNIQAILECLCGKCENTDELETETIEHKKRILFDPAELFGNFIKNVEDIVKIGETSKYP